MAKPKHPAGPAMTLGNMRELGVQNLVAFCLNDACRYTMAVDYWPPRRLGPGAILPLLAAPN